MELPLEFQLEHKLAF
jgi:hypothetical protein